MRISKLKWPNVARFNPWARKQSRRLDQYLETEQHEWMDTIERHRIQRDQKESLIDLEVFREGRECSNRLENREIRMSAMVLDYQRTLIAARIDIRKRLGLECSELLSEAQLSKLEEIMLRSVLVVRQARRDDYQRRAAAVGVPMYRPEQRDAAEYGDLEALVRREIRKRSLARSLGRDVKPAGTSQAWKLWSDPVWSKVIAGLIALIGAAFVKYLGCWSALIRP